jgi:hypothetical protein
MRKPLLSQIRPGQRTGHRGDGVRVPTEPDGEEHSLDERLRVPEEAVQGGRNGAVGLDAMVEPRDHVLGLGLATRRRPTPCRGWRCNRIAEQPGELPVPESHVTLAEERLAEYRRDPTRARSAYEVLERLASKRRVPVDLAAARRSRRGGGVRVVRERPVRAWLGWSSWMSFALPTTASPTVRSSTSFSGPASGGHFSCVFRTPFTSQSRARSLSSSLCFTPAAIPPSGRADEAKCSWAAAEGESSGADARSTPSPSTPQRADDNVVFIESAVQVTRDLSKVEAAQAGESRRRVGRAGSWETRKMRTASSISPAKTST